MLNKIALATHLSQKSGINGGLGQDLRSGRFQIVLWVTHHFGEVRRLFWVLFVDSRPVELERSTSSFESWR